MDKQVEYYLPLTPKQIQFCYEYISDLNASNAAERAGFNAHYAVELMKMPLVQQEIERLKDERIQRVLITADYVLVSLKEVADRCMQKVPVMRFNKVEKKMEQVTETVAGPDGELHEEGIWEFDSAGAIRALELLGKHLKVFPEGGIKLNVSATANAVSPLKNKTDKELDAIIARARF